MDVRMPDSTASPPPGLVRRPAAEARVLMLTTFDHDEYISARCAPGASGFLLKTHRRSELIAAIHAVAAGEALLVPAVTRR